MSTRKQRAARARVSETPEILLSTSATSASSSFRDTSFVMTPGASKRSSSYKSGSESPLNSSQLTRQGEKEFLGSLNSRLAQYIDRVRQLEQENNRLIVQIRDIEVVEKKEKSNLQERYEAEKDRLRMLLDAKTAQVAKLEIERDTAVTNYENLFSRVARLERDLKASDQARMQAESLVDNFQARVNSLENKLKNVEGENAELNKELDRLRKQITGLQHALEDESLLRAEAQNKAKTAQEDLDFERANHRQQLDDTRRKRQVDMTAMTKQLESEYENVMNERLNEMRADFADQLAQNRNNFEESFKNKLNVAREMAERFRDECSRLRVRCQELESTEGAAESELEGMRRKMSGLEAEIDRLRNELREKLANKDDRIFELNQEIQRLMTEYHDLIDIKIQLDSELKAYQVLLEGEESRLNLTGNSQNTSTTQHQVSFSGSSSAQRGTKRRRVQASGDEYDYTHITRRYESGQDGPITIDSGDEEGKSVTLRNDSNEDVHIGGWQLRVVANNEEVKYQFHNKMNFKAGTTVTVWSSNAGVTHKPPSDLVMKSQVWPVGANPEAVLTDDSGNRMAWMVAVGDDVLEGENPQDRCSIM